MNTSRTWLKTAVHTAFALILALQGAQALAQSRTTIEIRNTAAVSYMLDNASGGGTTHTEVTSNTVTFTILPDPTPGIIEFFRLENPGSPGSIDFPHDGGQCRNDQGEFGPLPDLDWAASLPAGGTLPARHAASLADTYEPGDLVVVRVTDYNRNEDPETREFVEITIETLGGDIEVLLLQETGVDTGVFAASIPSVGIPPPLDPYDCRLSLALAEELHAVYVDPGFPDDIATTVVTTGEPPENAVLLLNKTVSVPDASMGDFLQYRLVVENQHTSTAFNVVITDLLPAGLHYQAGSLWVGNHRASPELSADGRTLGIPVGTVEVGVPVEVRYVVAVGTSVQPGQLVNRARAAGTGGLVSNEAAAVVRIREPLMGSHFTIIGRVLSGACDIPADDLAGVPDIRVVLDDGTYVPTDENGMYHFEGVRAGTHVVQVDLLSVPQGMQVMPCVDNTRRAGRGYSQFVEAGGGALMRADFRLQPAPGLQGEVGIQLRLSRSGDLVRHEILLDGGEVPATGLRAMLMLPEGISIVPGTTTLDGAAQPDLHVAGGIATIQLGDPGIRWRRTLEFEAKPGPCKDEGHVVKAVAMFESGGEARRTPPAEATLACGPPGPPGEGARQSITIESTPAADEAVSPFQALAQKRAELAAMNAVPTGDRDWLSGQAPGNEFLLPREGDAADPTESVVVKHLPGHRVELSLNGEPVSALNADGANTNKQRTITVTRWRGVPMANGDNVLVARIVDATGATVETMERRLRYSIDVQRAVVVPEQSVLVADGVHKPVVAVRMLDGAGKPVRKGVTGQFSVSSPYQSAQDVERLQQRQLAGSEGHAPTWRVETDDGIAYIELQPTSLSGEAVLQFEFQAGERIRRQELKAWLKSQPREWIVVGFAKGTIGHDRLSGNMQALEEGGHEAGTSTDGQLSLYAKGRVKGEWMLTLAYDSDKPTDRLRREGLLSTIDPNQFYTLYGDGTAQAYDAASQEKLYLKLERDTFYALFGDFTTGLGDGELTRYQRTLNGMKVEYQGPILQVNAFAAETAQSYVRDEIQGDGTSGLYRLSRRNIAINGERVTIETRDRFRGEVIVESRTLARHIDYDIDYDAGTLFFRQPIPSRDFDFNPVFIVVEYETVGIGAEYLSAGGRVGVKLLEGRLEAGLTYIHDEGINGKTRLGGIDATYWVNESTEVHAEVASSRSEVLGVESSGNAYLVAMEHHGANYDLQAHIQRLGEGFGMGQQNANERGMLKAGADGQWRINDRFALQGQATHQEDLASGHQRNAVSVEGEYRADEWGLKAGLQWVRDSAPDGRVNESRQVTIGANRRFGRLELKASADIGLDGANDSVDYPNRFEVGASFALTEAFRVLVAHEITDGEERDTSTTRVGFEAKPWSGATLTSTLNQSAISEYGPRTFAVMGLQQRFVVSERWSVDLAADTSRAFNESGNGDLVVDDEHPIASGGIRRGGALTEDFIALSGGATYRSELWSWTGRLEGRNGLDSDRRGLDTAFLRQARDGVAFSASAQAFTVDNADGSRGLLASANLAWAWRPLGSRWSILDRLEFRVDEMRQGRGESVIGNDTLAVSGDARSRRIINNFALNYHGDAWTQDDRRGNLFDISQRSQLSLYYGAKYVFDTYDGDDYSGYTDILGVEWRHDLTSKVDIGLRGSIRHSWDEHEYSYAFGPSVGFSPFTNTWFTVGYNVVGFSDRDFESMHYTAQGPYLMLRLKFDQDTLGLAKQP